jgi:hypothetical protein
MKQADLIGPADFGQTAANLLWAIGETDHIFYDALGSFREEGHDFGSTYGVQGTVSQLKYRITYVPLLLLLGLLSCILAASIPAILLLCNWTSRTHSFVTWRALDPTRLIVDAVTGLCDDDSVWSMHSQHNRTLDDWGRRYTVTVAKKLDDKGVNIVLQPVGLAQKQDFHRGLKQRWRSLRDFRNKT